MNLSCPLGEQRLAKDFNTRFGERWSVFKVEDDA